LPADAVFGKDTAALKLTGCPTALLVADWVRVTVGVAWLTVSTTNPIPLLEAAKVLSPL
jgi:hypothetical protein